MYLPSTTCYWKKTILMTHYLFLGLFVVDIKQAFMELSL